MNQLPSSGNHFINVN